jgi:uncharacterized RDD family membrane protein YckC
MDNIADENKSNYAGIISRLIAYFIDCLLLFAGLLVWQAIIYFLNLNPIVRIMNSGGQPASWQIHLWVLLTASLPFLIYFAVMQSSKKQATIGMRLLKIKVTDLEDQRISFGTAILRSIIMLIPFEINHAIMFHLASFDSPPTLTYWIASVFVWILMIAYLAGILLTKRSQSIHDIFAETVVRRG